MSQFSLLQKRAFTVKFYCTRQYSTQTRINPWFVAHSLRVKDRTSTRPALPYGLRPAQEQTLYPVVTQDPVPNDAPEYLKSLHAALVNSPLLEPSELVISRPMQRDSGPGIPMQRPHGVRRKRGSTNAGIGIEFASSLWEWVVLAQVKEGTEGRGAITAVLRQARSNLLKLDPSLPMPTLGGKHASDDGWGMLDVGNIAIHVMSRSAKEKYFGNGPW